MYFLHCHFALMRQYNNYDNSIDEMRRVKTTLPVIFSWYFVTLKHEQIRKNGKRLSVIFFIKEVTNNDYRNHAVENLN